MVNCLSRLPFELSRLPSTLTLTWLRQCASTRAAAMRMSYRPVWPQLTHTCGTINIRSALSSLSLFHFHFFSLSLSFFFTFTFSLSLFHFHFFHFHFFHFHFFHFHFFLTWSDQGRVWAQICLAQWIKWYSSTRLWPKWSLLREYWRLKRGKINFFLVSRLPEKGRPGGKSATAIPFPPLR